MGLADLAPGLIAMAALFGTTSMEAIVITFEKRVGALERLLLAPLSVRAVLLGKILGGAIFGLMIAGIMTLLSLGVMGSQLVAPGLFLLVLGLTVLVLSALGALVAVSVKEVFEAQTLSNYFRFPMIFLCGVFLPVKALPLPLQVLAYLLPLTYAVGALQQTTLGLINFRLLVNFTALSLFLFTFLALTTRLFKKSFE